MPRPSEHQESHTDTIALLHECHDMCRDMFMMHVPKESGQNLSYQHIKRLQACIEICGTTASYLLKDGIKAEKLCEIAAQVCEQCAESCKKANYDHFHACADMCHRTAEACLDEANYLRKRMH